MLREHSKKGGAALNTDTYSLTFPLSLRCYYTGSPVYYTDKNHSLHKHNESVYNLPCSLRSMFSEEDDAHNPVHGSGSLEDAEKEIRYFFPQEKTVAVIKPNATHSRGKRTTVADAETLCIHVHSYNQMTTVDNWAVLLKEGDVYILLFTIISELKLTWCSTLFILRLRF